MTAFVSKNYWDENYSKGGNSGAGSYGRLADFKIRTVNDFIRDNQILSLLDYGCGDCNIAQHLDVAEYNGVDVSETAVKAARLKFKDDHARSFTTTIPEDRKFDMSLSMDVIFHLIEDEVYDDYITKLFACASRYVVIYSSNRVHEGKRSPHFMHRKFTDDIPRLAPGWVLDRELPNEFPYKGDTSSNDESYSDFFFFKRLT